MAMTTRTVSFNPTDAEAKRDRLHFAIARDGGNPSSAFELLADLLEGEEWKQAGSFGSFEEFVKAPFPPGLGLSARQLLVLIGEFEHKNEGCQKATRRRMEAMRHTVRDLLGPEIGPHGGLGLRTTKSKTDDVPYVLGRLKRDRPDLAERVLNKDMSANAAAIEAGFRKRSIKVTADVNLAAAALRRLFSSKEIARLVKELAS